MLVHIDSTLTRQNRHTSPNVHSIEHKYSIFDMIICIDGTSWVMKDLTLDIKWYNKGIPGPKNVVAHIFHTRQAKTNT